MPNHYYIKEANDLRYLHTLAFCILFLHSRYRVFSESRPFGCNRFSLFDSRVPEGGHLSVLFSQKVVVFRWDQLITLVKIGNHLNFSEARIVFSCEFSNSIDRFLFPHVSPLERTKNAFVDLNAL